jgi:hypothetical protein
MKQNTIIGVEEKFKFFMKNKKLMPPIMKEEYLRYKRGKNNLPRFVSIYKELKQLKINLINVGNHKQKRYRIC